jgi:hypothetical protein
MCTDMYEWGTPLAMGITVPGRRHVHWYVCMGHPSCHGYGCVKAQACALVCMHGAPLWPWVWLRQGAGMCTGMYAWGTPLAMGMAASRRRHVHWYVCMGHPSCHGYGCVKAQAVVLLKDAEGKGLKLRGLVGGDASVRADLHQGVRCGAWVWRWCGCMEGR